MSETLNAIEFSNNNITFRFIDIAVQVEIPLEFGDFNFIPGFPKSDSISRINLPIDKFSTLFYFNITKNDLDDNNFTNMFYAINSNSFNNSEDIPFSNAIVDRATAVSPTFRYQQQKIDFVRHLLREITTSIYMNGLFSNRAQLVENITQLDASFNTLIMNKLNICGTIQYPRDNNNYYNNPTRILFENLLLENDVIEINNRDRRAALITTMNTLVNNTYTSNNNTSYYLYAKVSNNASYKYFYPINITNTGTLTNEFVYDTFQVTTPYIDSNQSIANKVTTYDNESYTFYGGNMSNTIAPTNMSSYDTLHNTMWPVPLAYGDSLSVRLNYHPKDNNFCGKTVRDYSYEVYLNMGLESTYNMSYGNSSYVVGTANVVEFDGINALQTTGNASVYQHIFFNSENKNLCNNPSNLYISPYNFYPTLSDIQNIEYNASSDTDTTNWYLSVFTRPFTKDGVVGFERFNTIPMVTNKNVWESFNLDGLNASHELKWSAVSNCNCSSDWATLIDTPVNSSAPYGTIYKIEDFQIMIMSIVYDTPSTVSTIKNVKVTFKDGRVIQMV
uniref:Uncharacterized protein n=1 Tax=viral metagenome TaxID=1070528 RepID=A0A6C0JKC9_9ZZZZ